MSKIEAFWEDATAEDVAKIANTRKSIRARFRDEDNEDWLACLLVGWKLSKHLPGARWIDSDGAMWNHCQVYREPSYWTNRPDPGLGWRLLGKFPDEPKLDTDEYWSGEDWMPVGSRDNDQAEQVWYRRRIEGVEPKFAVGQTVKVVGPKGSDAKHWAEEMNEHLGKESAVSNQESKHSGWFYELGCSATWSFREDYLEAVEPKTVRLDEGSKCPVQGCSGVLRFRPVKDCSCHIRPPCSHCADNPPCCPVCEWTSGDPIEPVDPEPKHYVLRVGDSVETPRGHLINVVSSNAEQRIYSLDAGDKLTLPNGQTITITEKGFEVTE